MCRRFGRRRVCSGRRSHASTYLPSWRESTRSSLSAARRRRLRGSGRPWCALTSRRCGPPSAARCVPSCSRGRRRTLRAGRRRAGVRRSSGSCCACSTPTPRRAATSAGGLTIRRCASRRRGPPTLRQRYLHWRGMRWRLRAQMVGSVRLVPRRKPPVEPSAFRSEGPPPRWRCVRYAPPNECAPTSR